jgi:tetratricopeptide (TPR) repeat protein
MSEDTFLIQETENPQDSGSALHPSPAIGLGLVILLMAVISWLARKRDRSTAQSSTSNFNGANRPKQQPDQLPFTQALQWVSYGKELERSKQHKEAVAVYEQGLRQHPNDFHLWHERGLALAKLQQFEEAIESYDQAHKLRPTYRDLAHERGDTLLELGRYEEAIDAFNTYLRYAPGTVHILTDRGYALYHLGRYEEALQSFDQVFKEVRQDRDSVIRTHFYQIESLRQLGQLEAAFQSSQRAMKRYPTGFFKAQHEKLQQEMASSVQSGQ